MARRHASMMLLALIEKASKITVVRLSQRGQTTVYKDNNTLGVEP